MVECGLCQGENVVVSARGDFARARRCPCQQPCPICNDERYFYETDEFGYRNAIPCGCSRLDGKVDAFNKAAIPSRYLDATFGRINANKNAQDMAVARQKAWRFAREFEPGVQGLLFYGSTGTGKTYLTIAILRYLLINRGVRARFSEFMHLLSALRASYGDRGKAEDVLRPLVDVPLLVIDELGKGRGTDWELSVLDELISKRYNAQRTTIFTTNYGIEANQVKGQQEESLLDRVGVRIHSRLMEMCEPIRLTGYDYRREMGHQQR